MIKVIENQFVGDVETKELVEILKGYALGRRDMGDELAANLIELAADRLVRLEKNLKVARTERDSERARITRLIGMAHKEWLEKVYPDWYSRLEELDYNYDPVKDGEPWYRAKDVWACIEPVSEEHREFGGNRE